MSKHDPKQNQKLSRRGFLKQVALVSLGAAAPHAMPGAVVAQAAPLPPTHGSELRGINIASKDRKLEGRFGVMFKRLPAFAPSPDLLVRLAATAIDENNDGIDDHFLMEESPRSNLPNKANDNANELKPSIPEEPVVALTAGFTFLGQFIDHDITFDNTPLPDQQVDPDALKNFRTPRFDLDSVYGKGPLYEPQYYDPTDPDKLRLLPESGDYVQSGSTISVMYHDVKRAPVVFPDGTDKQVAVIPDTRNDQSLIVMQIHIAFMKFHNLLVEYVRSQNVPSTAVFETARRMTRWYYQWMVIHDFLPRVVGQDVVNSVYKDGPPATATLKYYDPANRQDRAFMPIEFAAGAYRFGHSMARARYTMSEFVLGKPVSGIPLFGKDVDNLELPFDLCNLQGQQPIPPRGVIQWRQFFNAPWWNNWTAAKPARKIDSRLSFPLFFLPKEILPVAEHGDGLEVMLAKRNLLRGLRVGVPSGQSVARAMSYTPLPNTFGSANDQPTPAPVSLAQRPKFNGVTGKYEYENDPVLWSILSDLGWKGEAPLWFYILKEAELLQLGRRLGPVGGRIVAEVLVGLLKRDPNGYLVQNPSWRPKEPFGHTESGKVVFTMADLLLYADQTHF